jgi:hypothetical protein
MQGRTSTEARREGFRNLELRLSRGDRARIEAERLLSCSPSAAAPSKIPKDSPSLRLRCVHYLEEEKGRFPAHSRRRAADLLQGDDPEKAFASLRGKDRHVSAHAAPVVPVHGLTPEEGVGKYSQN